MERTLTTTTVMMFIDTIVRNTFVIKLVPASVQIRGKMINVVSYA